MKPSTSTSLRTRPTAQQRELLSFTNAAVQALTEPTPKDNQVKSVSLSSKEISVNRQNGSSSELSLTTSGNDSSSFSDRRAVLKLGTDSNSSSSVSGHRDIDKMDLSSLDSSFNTSTAVRVRVPSSLLREIKPPVNRSVDGSGDNSVVDAQPTPKIVRHVNGPSAWVSMSTSSPLQLPEYSQSSHREPTSTTTVYTHEVLQANDVDKALKQSQKPKSHLKPREVVNEQISQEKQEERVKSFSDSKKGYDGIGLSQGDRVTGILIGNTGRSDSVKAKSFTLSQRERFLKEEFTKRQDRKSAPIKRSVQPTIITSKQAQKPDKEEFKIAEAPLENQVASAAAIAAAAASAATAPFLQVDARLRKLEELQQQLLSVQGSQIDKRPVNPYSVSSSGSDHVDIQYGPSAGVTLPANTKPSYPQVVTSDYPKYPQPTGSHPSTAIPQAAQPSFMHQLVQDHPFAPPPSQSLHTQPQRSINQDISQPRHFLQTDMQSQQPGIDNPSQQAFKHQHTSPYNGYPTSLNKIQQSKTQGIVNPHPTATQTETVYTQTVSQSYVPAKQLPQHEVSGKPLKNTKTQTTPQDSSLSSSDSPLQTPLPRRKPPRPTPHSTSKGMKYLDLPTRKKRVHFDYVDKNDPLLSYSKYEPIDYSEKARYERTGPTHHVTAASLTAPLRTAIQSKDKVAPTSETGIEQVMDELSRMRCDIRTVLTETEKMKSDLKHKKISQELDQKFSHYDHEPSILDAYLTKKDKKPHIDQVKSLRLTTSVVDHCADVKQILRDVEIQRNNLEHNLDAIVRQNEAETLYATVDSLIQDAQGTEVSRIRQNIDKMIKEMTTVIKNEIDNEGQKSKAKSETPINMETSNAKSKGKFQPGRKVPGKPYTFTGRQGRVGSGKENVPNNSKEKKHKVTQPVVTTKTSSKPVSKPVSKPISKAVSTSANQTYLKSIYGRQPHDTHRTTSKAPYLHYQSPVNPRTAALTAAILGTGSRHPTHPSVPEPIRENTEKPSKEAWYYFHPVIDSLQVIPSGDGRVHVHAPLEGRKMPMAIPLGKPRTDPSLRLPLPTDTPLIEPAKQEDPPAPPSQSTPIQSSPKPSPTKPNVAVITIQHKGPEEESSKKKKKTGKVAKKQLDLAVQVLPQMDVDSLTESSEGTSHFESHILDESKPVTRPADVEYEDFRNYLAVKDTQTEQEDQDDDDTPRIPTPENPLTIQGHTERDHLYHGPPFPPQHPPLPDNKASFVLNTDEGVSNALEDRALDWVEQELLARIVSEMSQPLPDPTLAAQPLSSPESSVMSDDGEILAATIGLGGIQLFVDAGIPVDRDLVAELIRDVVAEQIASTLGYPKPTATPKAAQVDVQQSPQTPEQAASPVTTPVPTPVYTPVESESSAAHSLNVSTPDPTPTPSESSVTMETEEEPTPVKEVKEDEKKELEPEVSVARSPIPTPVATPTSSQSPIASVSTPEPSTREPDITDVGFPVDTPERSVSLRSPKSTTASTPTTVESSEATPPPPAPPKVPSPVKSSPPSMTTSTLSPSTTSTLTTIDEELSEGQLIQPYVHGGKYSEGEYAMSPGLVDLVKERNVPVDTVDVMGKDEDSRNELIRIALHGLLRRGLYSTSSLNTTSTISTLRDADDIRQDSLDEYSHSEGEVIFPRDPVPVRYATGSVHAGASPRSRAKASPGELIPTALQSNRQSSPGETNTSMGARRAHPSIPNGRVIAATPGSPKQQRRQTPNTSRDNSDSRSLHKSDLQHGHWRQPMVSSMEGSPQRSPRNERHQSPNNSIGDRPHSRGSDRPPSRGTERQHRNGIDRQQPVFRPPIHVPIPSMEPDSSGQLSGGVAGYDLGDTSGDVSSISGGDF